MEQILEELTDVVVERVVSRTPTTVEYIALWNGLRVSTVVQNLQGIDPRAMPSVEADLKVICALAHPFLLPMYSVTTMMLPGGWLGGAAIQVRYPCFFSLIFGILAFEKILF